MYQNDNVFGMENMSNTCHVCFSADLGAWSVKQWTNVH